LFAKRKKFAKVRSSKATRGGTQQTGSFHLMGDGRRESRSGAGCRKRGTGGENELRKERERMDALVSRKIRRIRKNEGRAKALTIKRNPIQGRGSSWITNRRQKPCFFHDWNVSQKNGMIAHD